jgi:hypothetical protein
LAAPEIPDTGAFAMNGHRVATSVFNRRQLWLAAVALALAVGTVRGADSPSAAVSLVVDYGDGAQLLLSAIPWHDGMTVLDTLTFAQNHPHGVKFTKRGSGSGTLVTGIGGLANQGGGEKDKNWLFSLNGKSSTVGAGAAKLASGDAVLWKFQVYDYNSR